MHPPQRRRRSPAGTLRTLARWGLLGAVIAAVLALHVLTAEHTPGQHGNAAALPTESHSLVMLQGAEFTGATEPAAGDRPAGAVAPEVVWTDSVSVPVGLGHPGGGVDLLLGCVLFLVVAGPVLLLALLRGRRAPESTRATRLRPVVGTPLSVRCAVPRLALCVIRI